MMNAEPLNAEVGSSSSHFDIQHRYSTLCGFPLPSSVVNLQRTESGSLPATIRHSPGERQQISRHIQQLSLSRTLNEGDALTGALQTQTGIPSFVVRS